MYFCDIFHYFEVIVRSYYHTRTASWSFSFFEKICDGDGSVGSDGGDDGGGGGWGGGGLRSRNTARPDVTLGVVKWKEVGGTSWEDSIDVGRNVL